MTNRPCGRHRAPIQPALPSLVSAVGATATTTARAGVVLLAGAGLAVTMSSGAASTAASSAPATSTLRTAPVMAIRTGLPGSALFGARTMTVAARLRGTPYRYGGTTPRGFDCSGFTRYVVRAASGITLPRTAQAQRRATYRVSRASARPGDLVFFLSGSGRVYHVGVYAGHGYVWDSPRPGKRVSKRKIWTSHVSFGRVRA